MPKSTRKSAFKVCIMTIRVSSLILPLKDSTANAAVEPHEMNHISYLPSLTGASRSHIWAKSPGRQQKDTENGWQWPAQPMQCHGPREISKAYLYNI